MPPFLFRSLISRLTNDGRWPIVDPALFKAGGESRSDPPLFRIGEEIVEELLESEAVLTPFGDGGGRGGLVSLWPTILLWRP